MDWGFSTYNLYPTPQANTQPNRLGYSKAGQSCVPERELLAWLFLPACAQGPILISPVSLSNKKQRKPLPEPRYASLRYTVRRWRWRS